MKEGNTRRNETVCSLLCFLTTISIVMSATAIYGDERFRISEGDVHFCMDYTSFMSLPEDKKTYVEFYFAISRDQLTFDEMESGYGGAYEIEMILSRENRKPHKKSWLGGAHIDSLAEKEYKISLFDMGYFLLDPGRYTISVKMTDIYSGMEGIIQQRVSFPKFKDDELSLSQIEFASRIEKATENSKFIKNGILVLPNPYHHYGRPQIPDLYFYAEIYGLQFDNTNPSTYTFQYTITDSTGDVVKSCEPRTINITGSTSVIVGQTGIDTFSAGTHELELSVTDNGTGKTAFQKGRFMVITPPPPVIAGADTIFDEKRAQLERNIITYIASKREIELYDEFNLEGKKSFLNKFWEDRDNTPETELNEVKQEYIRRFHFSNINFQSSIEKEGWKTDMGRIYIQYGPPHEIDRNPADTETNAWEKWIYESLMSQGNVFFIFGDLEGFGRYTLLHSNLRGEKYDENWQNWINRYRGRY